MMAASMLGLRSDRHREYVELSSFVLARVPSPVAPVVMLHGLGADRSQLGPLPWGPVTRERSHLAPDLRGHGKAGATVPDDVDFGLLAGDVAELRHQIGDRPAAIVVGVSMGAAVAVRMAVDHPEQVGALVLIRPAWAFGRRTGSLEIFRVLAPYLSGEHGAADVDGFRTEPAFRQLMNECPGFAEGLLELIDSPARLPLAHLMRRLVDVWPTTAGAAATVSCPITVLGTDADPVHPRELAEAWAGVFPTAELRIVTSRYHDRARYEHEVSSAVEDRVRHAVGD